MEQKTALKKIQDFVEEFIRQWPEVFLVDVSIKNTSNKTTVLLDADNGMNVGRCADANRALYKFVEAENLFNGANFSMEVSSPGLDRPLKMLRQYLKNIGRLVEVVKTDDTVVEGKLLHADEEKITVETEIKQKKKVVEKQLTEIPFSEIRQVKVQIVF